MDCKEIVNQPVIEKDRFMLRPIRESDLGLIKLYASDKRVALMTSSIPHPLPPGMIEAFVSRAMRENREEDLWVMDGLQVGGSEVMGVIGLERLERNQSEISYWVAPAYYNTGLASDAVQSLVEANPMKNAAMFASVFQDNPVSARVLTHCGFEYLGDAEVFCIARNAAVATWTYSMKF